MTTSVEVQTELGSFVVALDEERAPVTSRNFLAYVDGGHMSRMTAYRIVTRRNQPPDTRHFIEVIQWGWRPATPDQLPPFPPIAHEPTSRTGISHRHLTISMVRFAPGTAGPGFFICIGDQPELDEGGRRNPDGHGFAAFGQVAGGEDVIDAIFMRAGPDEMCDAPVQVTGARRLAPA